MWDKATSNIFGTSVELLPDGLEAGVYSEGNDTLCMNKKTPKRSKKSNKDHTSHLENKFQKWDDDTHTTMDSVKQIIERVAIAPIEESVRPVQPV